MPAQSSKEWSAPERDQDEIPIYISWGHSGTRQGSSQDTLRFSYLECQMSWNTSKTRYTPEKRDWHEFGYKYQLPLKWSWPTSFSELVTRWQLPTLSFGMDVRVADTDLAAILAKALRKLIAGLRHSFRGKPSVIRCGKVATRSVVQSEGRLQLQTWPLVELKRLQMQLQMPTLVLLN